MKNQPARNLSVQLLRVQDDLGLVECHLDGLRHLVADLIDEGKAEEHVLLAIDCIREHIARRIKGDIRVLDTVRKHPLLDRPSVRTPYGVTETDGRQLS